MSNYRVYVTDFIYYELSIDADSEDQAVDIAYEQELTPETVYKRYRTVDCQGELDESDS